MLKKIVMMTVLFGSVAHARPSTFQMTCREAQDLVQEKGAIPLNYAYSPQAGWLFSRYVASGSYCDTNQMTVSTSVPTMDEPKCRLLTCADSNR